jgi:predicted small secreted protein
MKTFKKSVLELILIGLLSMFMAGCNTIEGVGEDIEEGGDRIEDAAD